MTSNIDTRPFFTRAQTSPSLVAKFVARRMRWGGGLFDRCSADEDENLNCCATRSPRAAQRRAVAARGSVSGDPSTRDAVRLSRIDVTARVSTRPRVCTRAAADQIPFAKESAKARQEIHSKRTQLISRRHVRRRYVRSHRARDLRGLSTILEMKRVRGSVVPIVSRSRSPFPRASRRGGAIPSALEKRMTSSRHALTHRTLPSLPRADRHFHTKQMRSPRSWWTWGRTR